MQTPVCRLVVKAGNILLMLPIGCHEGEVRLQEGLTPLQGHVELCRANTWGRVCTSGWTSIDARVVCRQLGYSATGIRSSLTI